MNLQVDFVKVMKLEWHVKSSSLGRCVLEQLSYFLSELRIPARSLLLNYSSPEFSQVNYSRP